MTGTTATHHKFYFMRLFSLLFFTLVFPLSVSSMVIVKDRKPLAKIVVDVNAGPQIKKAALLLQKYIQQSTGATLDIVNTPTADAIMINIGQTDFVKGQHINISAIDEDGFLLEGLNDKNYVIVGGSDWGTEYGIYDFLERFVGVKWLMPSDIGTIVPKVSTLDIKPAKILENPVYLSRELSPLNITADNPLGKWGRYNRSRGRINFHHNLANIFPPSKFTKSNPEFYPMVKGKRYLPSNDQDIRWQPNFSANDLVSAATSQILDYFKSHPAASSFSLGINDSDNFDESPGSDQRRSGRKNYVGFEDRSEDYFTWVNAVIKNVHKTYPDKKFGLLAYSNIAEPPASIAIDPSVIPFIAAERMRWANPTIRKTGEEMNLKWEKAVPALGWYDYDYGSSYLIPRVWFHEMQDYLKWGANHHVKYYYGELYPDWGEGPKGWVLSKLLWNPNRNVDSLLNVWYNNAVGVAAAPKLQEFYAIWEKHWTKDIYSSEHASWYMANVQFLPFSDLTYLLDVPDSYITRCDNLMAGTLKLAGNEQQKAFAAKIGEMWDYYKESVTAYKVKGKLKAFDHKNESPSPAFFDSVKTGLTAAQKRLVLLDKIKADSTIGNFIAYPHMEGKTWNTDILTQMGSLSNDNKDIQKRMSSLATQSDDKEVQRFAKAYTKSYEGTARNLMANNSFESGLTSWLFWVADPNKGKYSIASDNHLSGSKSLLVTGIQRGGPNQTVSADAGTYYATAHCYVPADYTKGTAQLVVQVLDGSGNVLTNNNLSIPPVNIKLIPGQWSSVRCPFELPASDNGSYKLRLIIQLNGFDPDGKIYIDDAGILKVGGN